MQGMGVGLQGFLPQMNSCNAALLWTGSDLVSIVVSISLSAGKNLLLHKRLWNSLCKDHFTKGCLQAQEGGVRALWRSRPHHLLNPSCSLNPNTVLTCKTTWVHWECRWTWLRNVEVDDINPACQPSREGKVPERNHKAQNKYLESQLQLRDAQRWSRIICSHIFC